MLKAFLTEDATLMSSLTITNCKFSPNLRYSSRRACDSGQSHVLCECPSVLVIGGQGVTGSYYYLYIANSPREESSTHLWVLSDCISQKFPENFRVTKQKHDLPIPFLLCSEPIAMIYRRAFWYSPVFLHHAQTAFVLSWKLLQIVQIPILDKTLPAPEWIIGERLNAQASVSEMLGSARTPARGEKRLSLLTRRLPV